MNEMIEFLSPFLFSYIYLCLLSKIMSNPINYKSVKTYIALLFSTILFFYMKYIEYKLILFILGIIIISWYLWKEKIKNSIVATSIMFFLTSTVDIGIAIALLVLKNHNIDTNTTVMAIISILIPLICLILLNINTIKKFKKYLLSNVDKYVWISVLLLGIISIPNILNVLETKISKMGVIIGLNVLLLFVSLLVIKIISEKSNSQQMKREYHLLTEYVVNCEKNIDQVRMMRHEQKNNLLLIKSMIQSKDKSVIPYIDTLLETNIKKDAKIISMVNKIPFSIIRGVAFHKLLEANQQSIHINLDISPKIKMENLKTIPTSDMADVARIISIFLDNAMDAVEKIENKQLDISIYINDKNQLIFSIGNTFDDSQNIEYRIKNNISSKGKNHGYGLLIAKKIVQENKRIKTDYEIISNVFIQNIYINIK